MNIKSNPGYALHLNGSECQSQLEYFNADEELNFLSDGTLYTNDGIEVNVYKEGFCVENFYLPESGKIYLSGILCQNAVSVLKLKSFNSSKYDMQTENLTENLNYLMIRIIYTVCGLISLFFLFFTIFLYQRLPELNNFQGEITTIYLLSISLTTFLLTLSYNVRLKDDEDPNEDLEYFIDTTKNFCVVLGYSIYFFAILMFSWMSVLSFDLFWSFSYTSVPLKDQNNKFKRKCYNSFGFGAPTVMTTMIILIDAVNSSEKLTVPGVGKEHCFLSFQGARYFFYIPISALLITNLILYLTTLVSLCQSFKATHIASSQRRNPLLTRAEVTF